MKVKRRKTKDHKKKEKKKNTNVYNGKGVKMAPIYQKQGQNSHVFHLVLLEIYIVR